MKVVEIQINVLYSLMELKLPVLKNPIHDTLPLILVVSKHFQ